MTICANCGEGNRLRQLRMANEKQCIISYVTFRDNNVTQFTVDEQRRTIISDIGRRDNIINTNI